MDPEVPLIVPEVNADAISGFRKKNIIANPNCSTAQLVVALKPIHDRARIRRVVVSTYQSVSGAGKDAMDELFEQTRAVFVSDPIEAKKFPKRIAFNLIPQIDVFMEDGFTKEEWKMMVETKKILDPRIKLVATCVRVPVFVSHSEAVTLELESPLSAEEAQEILREAPGCLVIDKHEPGATSPPTRRPARMRPTSAASARTPRSRTASHVDRVGQSAQGRGPQRGADRRGADQPQAHRGEAPGSLIRRDRAAPIAQPGRRAYPSTRRRRARPRRRFSATFACPTFDCPIVACPT